MKIFCGGIMTETNGFSPLPVGLASFEENGLRRGKDALAGSYESAVSTAAEELVCKTGGEVVHGLTTQAQPGGRVRRDAWEYLRGQLLSDLEAAMPVDVVALNLHGAMMADGYDDCEGDLLSRVRTIVGADIPVGAELDPHCHLSGEMVSNADVLCCYKENPHTDITVRAEDLLRILADCATGRIRPVMSVFDCRQADVFQTNREPMQSFVARLRQLEQRENIIDISIAHGFRRADIPIMGAKVIVTTHNDPGTGERLAAELGRELFGFRGRAAQPCVPMIDAVRQALAAPEGPVVLADGADNPGGGSPGDSTYIIHALLNGGGDRLAAGILWDPIAVRFAREAGTGAELKLRVGGKACRLSGNPLDLEVRVGKIDENAALKFGDIRIPMGTTVAFHAPEIDLLVSDVRSQTFSPNLFYELGIDLGEKRAVVVKSAQHYRAAFAAIAAFDVVVDAPGVCTADISSMEFNNISRPMWPFDEDPFTGD